MNIEAMLVKLYLGTILIDCMLLMGGTTNNFTTSLMG